jgi:hypothetical protein
MPLEANQVLASDAPETIRLRFEPAHLPAPFAGYCRIGLAARSSRTII